MSVKGAPRGVRLDARLHVLLTAEQHRQAKVVAAAEGTDVSDLIRRIFLPEIAGRYRRLGVGATKARSQP